MRVKLLMCVLVLASEVGAFTVDTGERKSPHQDSVGVEEAEIEEDPQTLAREEGVPPPGSVEGSFTLAGDWVTDKVLRILREGGAQVRVLDYELFSHAFHKEMKLSRQFLQVVGSRMKLEGDSVLHFVWSAYALGALICGWMTWKARAVVVVLWFMAGYNLGPFILALTVVLSVLRSLLVCEPNRETLRTTGEKAGYGGLVTLAFVVALGVVAKLGLVDVQVGLQIGAVLFLGVAGLGGYQALTHSGGLNASQLMVVTFLVLSGLGMLTLRQGEYVCSLYERYRYGLLGSSVPEHMAREAIEMLAARDLALKMQMVGLQGDRFKQVKRSLDDLEALVLVDFGVERETVAGPKLEAFEMPTMGSRPWGATWNNVLGKWAGVLNVFLVGMVLAAATLNTPVGHGLVRVAASHYWTKGKDRENDPPEDVTMEPVIKSLGWNQIMWSLGDLTPTKVSICVEAWLTGWWIEGGFLGTAMVVALVAGYFFGPGPWLRVVGRRWALIGANKPNAVALMKDADLQMTDDYKGALGVQLQYVAGLSSVSMALCVLLDVSRGQVPWCSLLGLVVVWLAVSRGQRQTGQRELTCALGAGVGCWTMLGMAVYKWGKGQVYDYWFDIRGAGR